MKQFKHIGRTLLQGLFEYVLLFPVVLMIGIVLQQYLDFPLLYWLIALPIALMVGIVFRSIVQNKKWWLYALMALVIGLSTTVFMPLNTWTTWIVVIILPIMTFRGMLYASRPWHSLLPIAYLWAVGFIGYFVTYFIFRYVDMFSDYLYLVTSGGTLFVIGTLFVSNTERLKTSTLEKDQTPYISRTIKKQNKIIILFTIGVILIGNLSIVRDGFLGVIRFIMGFIFSSSGEEEEITPDDSPPPTGEMQLPGKEEAEAHPFFKFLEQVVIYAFYVLLVVAVLVLIFLLIKKSRVWLLEKWKQFIQFLKGITKRFEQEDQAPYIDEKETVFDWKRWREKQQDKAKGLFDKIFKREPGWDALSNEDKVRFIYRHVVEQKRDEIDYADALTAKETLEQIQKIVEHHEAEIDLLRTYYEDVRYSDRGVDAKKIQEIEALLDNK